MSQVTLFIRADATAAMGAGHAMRMATLASAWQRAEYGPVRWSGEIAIPFVNRRLESLRLLVENPETAVPDGAVLAVDNYSPAVRSAGARESGAVLRLLADDGSGPIPTGYDLIWWPAPFGDRERYGDRSVPVVTGPDAVGLREDLPTWTPDGGGRTAVSLGGGTLPEQLASALRLVGERVGRDGFMATGNWAPASWQAIPADEPWGPIARCQRLIVAAGVSALEAAAVGVPVVVVAFTDNQQSTLAWARANGVPTIDVVRHRDAAELVRAFELALPQARPLPRLVDGSAAVATRLSRMAGRIPA